MARAPRPQCACVRRDRNTEFHPRTALSEALGVYCAMHVFPSASPLSPPYARLCIYCLSVSLCCLSSLNFSPLHSPTLFPSLPSPLRALGSTRPPSCGVIRPCGGKEKKGDGSAASDAGLARHGEAKMEGGGGGREGGGRVPEYRRILCQLPLPLSLEAKRF